MKALLLRVGIDKGSGGCLAPLFRDGSFEYIPLPEKQATSERRVYVTMKGITGRPLLDFVPKKIWYSHPHYDPEFTTYTYGDPTKVKRNQLSQLEPGDLLVFYAGLQLKDSDNKSHLFVIGYFNVDKVYDFLEITDYESVFKELPNNAHSKRYSRLKELKIEYSDKDLVIVKGKSATSKLFRKALPLGDKNDKMRSELVPIFGYNGSLKRAVGHWIEHDNFQQVKEWLNRDENTYVKSAVTLYLPPHGI
ncbi:MAG TPA: hypothetical protein ENN68_00160 [Methanomicrobia archaeon]|nr:hypothetical protein [Methanomicrobia archaeon]